MRQPRAGEVYNAGGGRTIHCSIREAIALTERIVGKAMRTRYVEQNRVADHISGRNGRSMWRKPTPPGPRPNGIPRGRAGARVGEPKKYRT